MYKGAFKSLKHASLHHLKEVLRGQEKAMYEASGNAGSLLCVKGKINQPQTFPVQ